MKKFKIGVVGYSHENFNHVLASQYLEEALDHITYYIKRDENMYNGIEIVSGVSNSGIPKLAYELAVEKDIDISGISAPEVLRYDTFPGLTDIKLYGENFGDESEMFIDYIDALIKVGGGEQSEREKELFLASKGSVNFIEFDLEVTDA